MTNKRTRLEELAQLVDEKRLEALRLKAEIEAIEADNAYLSRLLESMSAPSGTVGASSVEET